MTAFNSHALTRAQGTLAEAITALALMLTFLITKTVAVIALIRALAAPDATGSLTHTTVCLIATSAAVGLAWLLWHVVGALDEAE